MSESSGRPPGRPIGFWLKLLDTLIDSGFDHVLTDDGLERRHWQVLNVLSEGPSTVSRLAVSVAPFLSVSSPSVPRTLADLTSRGWVEDQLGSVMITEAGAAAHARISAVVAANRRQLLGDLTPEQYVETVEVLRQMALNLGWTEP